MQQLLTRSLFSSACFLNCSNTELEAVDGCAGFEWPRGLEISRGGLWPGLFLRSAAGGAGGLVGGATVRVGGEYVGCERRPIMSAADVLFIGAGCCKKYIAVSPQLALNRVNVCTPLL